jgi:hypothetical protein
MNGRMDILDEWKGRLRNYCALDERIQQRLESESPVGFWLRKEGRKEGRDGAGGSGSREYCRNTTPDANGNFVRGKANDESPASPRPYRRICIA